MNEWRQTKLLKDAVWCVHDLSLSNCSPVRTCHCQSVYFTIKEVLALVGNFLSAVNKKKKKKKKKKERKKTLLSFRHESVSKLVILGAIL